MTLIITLVKMVESLISHEDVEDSCAKWKKALVGVVLCHNPSYFAMRKFVDNKWINDGAVRVSKLKNGTFIFLFEEEGHMKRILEQVLWLFSTKMLVLKPWSPNVKF